MNILPVPLSAFLVSAYRGLLPLATVLIAIFFIFGDGTRLHAQSPDAIPDNCEVALAPDQQVNLFVRYEAHNRRLVLVDWTTGDVARVLGENLDDTIIRQWSVTCRYVAVAVRTGGIYTTLVYDVMHGGVMGSIPDGVNAPHWLHWGPDDYLLAERRTGAVLWHVPSGQQIPLDTGYNSVTGRAMTRVRWDAVNLQVIVNLAVGGRAVYDLTTGARVEVAAEEIDGVDAAGLAASIYIGGGRYVCGTNRGNYYARTNSLYNLTSNELATPVVPYWDNRYNLLTYRLLNNYTIQNSEIIATLQADAAPVGQWLNFVGWTADCTHFIMQYGNWNRDGRSVQQGYEARDRVTGLVVSRATTDHRRSSNLRFLADGRIVTSQYDLGSQTGDSMLWSVTNDTLTPITEDERAALVSTSASYRGYPYSNNTRLTDLASSGGDLSVLPSMPGAPGRATWNRCPFTVYYGGRVGSSTRSATVRYDDGREVVLETDVGLVGPYRRNYYLDPTCRYVTFSISVAAHDPVGYDATRLEDDLLFANNLVVIHDLVTGQRVAEILDNRRALLTVDWSVQSEYALIVNGAGAFIWNAYTGTVVVLHDGPNTDCAALRLHPRVLFDPPSGQLWVSTWSGNAVYNLRSGECRQQFFGFLRNDFSTSLLYLGVGDFIHILNRYTVGTVGLVDNDSPGRSIDEDSRIITVSPDGRWFVSGNNTRTGAFSVWDLSALPAELNARDPVFVHAMPMPLTNNDLIDAITFSEGGMMEVTYRDGTVSQWSTTTWTRIDQ